MSAPVRTRTVTWEDPQRLAEAAVTMSGPDFFAALAKGELPRPPVAELLDFTATSTGDGEAVFVMEPAEFHYNPLGTVHGGVLATVLDSALGCAVQTKLPPGAGYTTLELKVNYVRPVTTASGPLRCVGRVLHLGRRTATAEARIEDAAGRLCAHATTTCMVLEATPQPTAPATAAGS